MTLAARTSRWPAVRTPARKRRDPTEIGATDEKDRQSEQDNPANKRKAKLKAKHRRQRARATG